MKRRVVGRLQELQGGAAAAPDASVPASTGAEGWAALRQASARPQQPQPQAQRQASAGLPATAAVAPVTHQRGGAGQSFVLLQDLSVQGHQPG